MLLRLSTAPARVSEGRNRGLPEKSESDVRTYYAIAGYLCEKGTNAMIKLPVKIELKGGPAEGLESKQGLARLEIKEAANKGALLHIKAYALAFGNVDSWGDIIEAGACDAFLKSPSCRCVCGPRRCKLRPTGHLLRPA